MYFCESTREKEAHLEDLRKVEYFREEAARVEAGEQL